MYSSQLCRVLRRVELICNFACKWSFNWWLSQIIMGSFCSICRPMNSFSLFFLLLYLHRFRGSWIALACFACPTSPCPTTGATSPVLSLSNNGAATGSRWPTCTRGVQLKRIFVSRSIGFFYCGAEWPKSAWGLSLGSVSGGGGGERLQISTVFYLSLSSFSAHCCQCDFLSLPLKVQPGPPKHHWPHFWRSFAPSDDNLDSSGFQRFLNRVYTNIYIHSRTKGDMKNIHCGTAHLYFMFTC